MKNKKMKKALIAALIIVLTALVIAAAITGAKLMLHRYTFRPVPINPFMSYGQRIGEADNEELYLPIDDCRYRIIAP